MTVAVGTTRETPGTCALLLRLLFDTTVLHFERVDGTVVTGRLLPIIDGDRATLLRLRTRTGDDVTVDLNDCTTVRWTKPAVA